MGKVVSYEEKEGGYAYVIFADSSILGVKKIRKSFIVKILTDDRFALPELATERWYKLAEDIPGVFRQPKALVASFCQFIKTLTHVLGY